MDPVFRARAVSLASSTRIILRLRHIVSSHTPGHKLGEQVQVRYGSRLCGSSNVAENSTS